MVDKLKDKIKFVELAASALIVTSEETSKRELKTQIDTGDSADD